MPKEQTLEAPTKPELPRLTFLGSKTEETPAYLHPDTVSSDAAQKTAVQCWVPGVGLRVPAALGNIWVRQHLGL